MRGRKKLPTELKMLKGTMRKHREQSPGMIEAKIARSGYKAPRNLRSDEKKIWNQHAKLLYDAGLLTDVDYPQLVGFCVAMATVDRMRIEIKDRGDVIVNAFGTLQKNPAWNIMKESLLLVNKFGSEFGLSPAARSRVKVPEKKDVNPLKALLGQKR